MLLSLLVRIIIFTVHNIHVLTHASVLSSQTLSGSPPDSSRDRLPEFARDRLPEFSLSHTHGIASRYSPQGRPLEFNPQASLGRQWGSRPHPLGVTLPNRTHSGSPPASLFSVSGSPPGIYTLLSPHYWPSPSRPPSTPRHIVADMLRPETRVQFHTCP